MTKNELIEEISKSVSKGDLSKKTVEAIVEGAFTTIEETIKKTGRFSYPSFGTFTIINRSARKGRNPRTGEAIDIKASKSVKFKPAPALKDNL